MAPKSNLQLVESEDSFSRAPKIGKSEEGSSFGWFDRLFFGWRDGMVFDYGDWEARDLTEMMAKDYKARQIENALTLPVVSAERTIEKRKGGKEEAKFLRKFFSLAHHQGGMHEPLDLVWDQMTSAFTFKRAYFEKTFKEWDGAIVYDHMAWRPQTTCRLLRDPKNGHMLGFEQEAYYVGPEITKGHWPIIIPNQRAFVYVHGQRRDPMNGISDLEIPYWCYKTKQKILFLWFQFAETVSLPRTVVKAQDIGVAQQIASEIARLKSTGVIPVAAPSGPDSVGIDVLDNSGKGGEQFQQIITWLDQAATNSNLQGFLDLTGAAANGAGSYALSKDASDFYLQMEEAKVKEMARSIENDVFAPLIRWNFGPKGIVPRYSVEPLNDIDKSSSVDMLQQLFTREAALVPDEFIQELAVQVASYLGMDPAKVEKSFKSAAFKAQQAAAKAQASPQGQQVAGVAAATNQATSMVQNAVAVPKIQARAQAMAAKAGKPPVAAKPAAAKTAKVPATAGA